MLLWAWTHRWDRTLREESLKSDLQTITKVPHYALFRAIYQFIAHFLIPFMRSMNHQMHLMHSGTLESHLTPHAHIWSGRDLDMGCSFGLIRMTPLWRVWTLSFPPSWIEFSLQSFSICSSYSVNQRFPIFSIVRLIVEQRIESAAKVCFRGHIIGYWSPQSIINWEL